jgi:uncharacterized protein YjbI with pentapeptide repeats
MMYQLNLDYRRRAWLLIILPAITLALLATAFGVSAEDGPTLSPSPKIYQKSLSHQKMEGKSLRGADLSKTEMTMTHFERADLQGADFTGSEMDRAELADANLSHARGLGTVDFGLGIKAQRTNFQNADLHHACIPGTYFEDADFRGANLRGAFLAGRFHGAKFEDADVQEAVFLGTSGIESLHADLRRRGAIVNAEDLAQSVRNGRDFTGCDFSGFQLADAQLDSASFRRVNLHSANLQNASLCRVHMSEAKTYWANLSGAKLIEADLANAHLDNTNLTGADLSGANCRSATFSGSRFNGAKLRGTDLTNADFRGADLTGVDFSDAILEGLQWDAAILVDIAGMTTAEQAELQSKSARWKYDLAQGFSDFVRKFSVPVWLFSWVWGAGLLYRGRRQALGDFSLQLMTGLHAVAALPALAFLFLYVSSTSPTVQLSSSFNGWSAWVQLWPLAMGLSVLAILAFIPVATFAWIIYFRCGKHGSIIPIACATLLTGISVLASFGTLLQLAPSA